MKKIIIAATLSLLSTAAFADASMDWKGGTNANGSQVGYNSSQNTGNGGPIGGHGGGMINGSVTGHDDTTYAGSRSDAVQGLHEAEGRGRSNGNGNARDNHGANKK